MSFFSGPVGDSSLREPVLPYTTAPTSDHRETRVRFDGDEDSHRPLLPASGDAEDLARPHRSDEEYVVVGGPTSSVQGSDGKNREVAELGLTPRKSADLEGDDEKFALNGSAKKSGLKEKWEAYWNPWGFTGNARTVWKVANLFFTIPALLSWVVGKPLVWAGSKLYEGGVWVVNKCTSEPTAEQRIEKQRIESEKRIRSAAAQVATSFRNLYTEFPSIPASTRQHRSVDNCLHLRTNEACNSAVDAIQIRAAALENILDKEREPSADAIRQAYTEFMGILGSQIVTIAQPKSLISKKVLFSDLNYGMNREPVIDRVRAKISLRLKDSFIQNFADGITHALRLSLVGSEYSLVDLYRQAAQLAQITGEDPRHVQNQIVERFKKSKDAPEVVGLAIKNLNIVAGKEGFRSHAIARAPSERDTEAQLRATSAAYDQESRRLGALEQQSETYRKQLGSLIESLRGTSGLEIADALLAQGSDVVSDNPLIVSYLRNRKALQENEVSIAESGANLRRLRGELERLHRESQDEHRFDGEFVQHETDVARRLAVIHLVADPLSLRTLEGHLQDLRPNPSSEFSIPDPKLQDPRFQGPRLEDDSDTSVAGSMVAWPSSIRTGFHEPVVHSPRRSDTVDSEEDQERLLEEQVSHALHDERSAEIRRREQEERMQLQLDAELQTLRKQALQLQQEAQTFSFSSLPPLSASPSDSPRGTTEAAQFTSLLQPLDTAPLSSSLEVREPESMQDQRPQGDVERIRQMASQLRQLKEQWGKETQEPSERPVSPSSSDSSDSFSDEDSTSLKPQTAEQAYRIINSLRRPRRTIARATTTATTTRTRARARAIRLAKAKEQQ